MNKLLRCAIYTRKSSEEGLEQGFNSLDAQREACEAFIASQQHEGWRLVPTFYDDGGYSGGNMDRPALKQLLQDIDQKKINVVVVYKVDRLTRSLADFAKIVEQFDAKGISFVSVTQQFNTTSSMGRLTLNVLLSFAQFEREVTGERIRDKIAASKAKGMWMGGTPPIGYKAHERTLAIDEHGANLVRHIYERYLSLGNVRLLTEELGKHSIQTPQRISLTEQIHGGKPFWRGQIYRILTNPVYIGQIVHRDKAYEGDHPLIITLEQWDRVQQLIAKNRQGHRARQSTPSDSLLSGLVFDQNGNRLIASHSQKRSKRYRYYLTEQLQTGTRKVAPDGIRIPAMELENVVTNQLIDWLSDTNALLDAIHAKANVLEEIKQRAQSLIANLQTNSPERYHSIQDLIKKLTVHPKSIELEINLGPLHLGSPAHQSITLEIPAQIERCGFSTKLLIEGKPTNQQPDRRLIQSISTAYDWLNKLTTGKAASIGELAKQEGVTNTAITSTIYRAFLAPDIVRSILEGTQPISLTSSFLKTQMVLPMDWEEQRQLFGFNKP